MSSYVLSEYLDCEKERAQLRAERDAAQAELAKPREDWREDWQASFDSLTAEYDKQFARADAALAEAARYKALWDAVPWDRLHEATLRLRYYEHQEPNASDECLADGLDAWLAAYAPQPQGEGAQ